MSAGPPRGSRVGAEAQVVFGDRLGMAERYAQLLAGDGVAHGLIGPREADRVWERHLVNCALVTELVPLGARVVDVGSGAGLPGLAMACRRADLTVVLVEPMQRRVDFLRGAIESLGLSGQATVLRGRAESPAVRAELGRGDWVTARAVAPLERLAHWCLPLLRPGGQLLALKGARARIEVAEQGPAIRRAGGVVREIAECGVGLVAEPTVVVVVERAERLQRI